VREEVIKDVDLETFFLALAQEGERRDEQPIKVPQLVRFLSVIAMPRLKDIFPRRMRRTTVEGLGGLSALMEALSSAYSDTAKMVLNRAVAGVLAEPQTARAETPTLPQQVRYVLSPRNVGVLAKAVRGHADKNLLEWMMESGFHRVDKRTALGASQTHGRGQQKTRVRFLWTEHSRRSPPRGRSELRSRRSASIAVGPVSASQPRAELRHSIEEVRELFARLSGIQQKDLKIMLKTKDDKDFETLDDEVIAVLTVSPKDREDKERLAASFKESGLDLLMHDHHDQTKRRQLLMIRMVDRGPVGAIDYRSWKTFSWEGPSPFIDIAIVSILGQYTIRIVVEDDFLMAWRASELYGTYRKEFSFLANVFISQAELDKLLAPLKKQTGCLSGASRSLKCQGACG